MICEYRELGWLVMVALLLAAFSIRSLSRWRRIRAGSVATLPASPARYRLTRKLGEGGMGEVYEGREARGYGRVAVKLMRGQTNSRRLARFEREIRMLESIQHRNVVALREHGRTRDGSRYLAMELLEGMDLQRVVDDYGAQPPERVVIILLQLCEALAAVHDAGVVHRDIKPANVFLCGGVTGAPFVKLLDFGLSTRADEMPSENNDEIVGSPYNMAPECFTTPGAVGPAADLYALGVLAYTLLVGTPPFATGGLIDIAAQHLYAEPPSLVGRGVSSPELQAVIASCLEKSPERRPVSARVLLRALRACPEAPALVASGWSRERRALTDTRRSLRSTEVDARDRFGIELARQARALRARAA